MHGGAQAIEKLMFDLSVWRCSPELKVGETAPPCTRISKFHVHRALIFYTHMFDAHV
jgi:hypothetical protein